MQLKPLKQYLAHVGIQQMSAHIMDIIGEPSVHLPLDNTELHVVNFHLAPRPNQRPCDLHERAGLDQEAGDFALNSAEIPLRLKDFPSCLFQGSICKRKDLKS